ncbi:MAG: patatin-like phospholipase family protein [Nitrospira sp.]|nr:MAG: patatin-like phospholipase family protein [Nitrospira sp.]
MFKFALIVSSLTILTLPGCFAKVQTLPAHPQSETSVFGSIEESSTLVGIALSGGGSRAATFAAGALEALASYPVKQEEKTVSLLETITHMSSVSGGSLATAYYAMKKPGKSEPVLQGASLSSSYKTFFSDFQRDMQMNFQGRALARQLLFFRALNPAKLAYSFAEVWDSHFFNGQTFSVLYEREQRGDAPRVILNGTIYNTGRRLALTTLGPQDFKYDFVEHLKDSFAQRNVEMSKTGKEEFTRSIETARKQFMPITFEGIGSDHHTVPISLAVASSASFPPIVGPVTYQTEGTGRYTHVGDGGLFDNLGTESLTTLFLSKIPKDATTAKRGLIVVIDASFPFSSGEQVLNHNTKGFQVFRKDPARIVGIMEARANAYQTILWQSLRSQDVVLPDYDHLRIVILRHSDARWERGYEDLPDVCRSEFAPSVSAQEIQAAVDRIPTQFKIESDCDGALLVAAGHQVVAQQRELLDRFFYGVKHRTATMP